MGKEHFRLLVEDIKDYAILLLDPDGRVTSWNAGAEKIKGDAAEEITGEHFSRFYPRRPSSEAGPNTNWRSPARRGG